LHLAVRVVQSGGTQAPQKVSLPDADVWLHQAFQTHALEGGLWCNCKSNLHMLSSKGEPLPVHEGLQVLISVKKCG